jgi:hypothetical protein
MSVAGRVHRPASAASPFVKPLGWLTRQARSGKPPDIPRKIPRAKPIAFPNPACLS